MPNNGLNEDWQIRCALHRPVTSSLCLKKMNEMENQKGKNIFYTLFSLNLIATIGERIFPVFYLDVSSYLPKMVVSIIILFFWFYAIYKGYNWPKYALIILGFLAAIISINNAWNIYSAKAAFYGEREITDNTIALCVLFLNGLIYLSTALLFLFSKSLKSFLNWKRSFISMLSKRERLANSIYGIGVVIAIVGASWGFSIGLINTISNPKLIIGFLVYLPIKIPLYAIPGFVIIFLGSFLKKNDNSGA